ncbi:hypothetical protein BDR06DRAFT_948103, partial [Suillus hirtellus]
MIPGAELFTGVLLVNLKLKVRNLNLPVIVINHEAAVAYARYIRSADLSHQFYHLSVFYSGAEDTTLSVTEDIGAGVEDNICLMKLIMPRDNHSFPHTQASCGGHML